MRSDRRPKPDQTLAPRPALGPWLQRTWDLRRSGAIKEVEKSYQEKLLEWRLAPSEPWQIVYRELERRGITASDSIDFLLIPVSLLRHALTNEAAASQLAAIAQQMPAHVWSEHYQAAFQSGLNALGRGERIEALELFVAAARVARNKRERLAATFNLALCKEDLGLPIDREAEALLQLVETVASEPWASGYVGQLDALLARTAYRQADLTALNSLLCAPPRGDQATYYSALVAKLPFLQVSAAAAAAALQLKSALANRVEDGYAASYELRTITEAVHDADLRSEIRSTERIERFYSWTWGWLTGPDAKRLDAVLAEKEHLCRSSHGLLSWDDFLQFECALRWLGLFAGLATHDVQAQLGTIQTAHSMNAPILEYERLLLDYLYSRRDGHAEAAATCHVALAQHPLADRQGFLLPSLLSSLRVDHKLPNGLAVLRASLADLVKQDDSGATIVVDLNRSGRIQNSRRQDREEPVAWSYAAAQALRLFAANDAWPVAILVQVCFGFSRYKQVDHDPKIAQFILQLNKLVAPTLKFRRRHDHVVMSGPTAAIRLRHASIHAQLLLADERMFHLSPRKMPPEKSALRPPQPLGEIVSRRDLELLLGKSKTAVTRRILQWLDEGLMEKTAYGRETRYRLAPGLRSELHPPSGGSPVHR